MAIKRTNEEQNEHCREELEIPENHRSFMGTYHPTKIYQRLLNLGFTKDEVYEPLKKWEEIYTLLMKKAKDKYKNNRCLQNS